MINKQEDTNSEVLVRTISVLDCGGRCPLRMYVKDGMITSIETDDCENTVGNSVPVGAGEKKPKCA